MNDIAANSTSQVHAGSADGTWWPGSNTRALYRDGLNRTTRAIYDVFLDLVSNQLECELMVVWSLDPVHKQLILQSVRGAQLSDFDKPVLGCSESFSGEAVERKDIVDFPDVLHSIEAEKKTFGNSRLLSLRKLQRMICIPVYNTANYNQIIAVINLFPKVGVPTPSFAELERMAEDLAIIVENCLRDRCIRFANRVEIDLRKVKVPSREAYSRVLARTIRSALHCDEVLFFLESPDQDSLDFAASAGVSIAKSILAGYPRDLVMFCLRTNRENLLNEFGPPPGRDLKKPGENDVSYPKCSAYIPIRDIGGQAKGVILCSNELNKAAVSVFRAFTYDDVAVVDAIAQAFGPQLELLIAEQRRIERLTFLAHELRVPVVAFNAALGRLRKECLQHRYQFQFDYLENLFAYSGVMAKLLKELELLRMGPDRIILSVSGPVMLYGSVIAPAVRFIRSELRSRHFRPDQIQRFEGLDTIPPLYVDSALMTQVVLNLLLNAIKYFGENRRPEEFWLKIEGRRTKSGFEISFKDLGIGVPDGYEEAIFEHGVRAPNAKFDPTGDGLGLWISRELVRRHGGHIELRCNRGPTEFVIILPDSLSLYPPKEQPTEPESRS